MSLLDEVSAGPQVSAYQETAPGVYEAVLTAGDEPGTTTVTTAWRKAELSKVNIILTALTGDQPDDSLFSSNIEIIKNNAVANSNDRNLLKVTLKDSNGRALPYQEIRLSTESWASLIDNVITDEKGVAEFDILSDKAKPTLIKLLTKNKVYSTTVNFISDLSSAAPKLDVKKKNALADGVDQNFVQVGLRDSNGNFVPDQQVTLAATQGVTVAGRVNTGPNGHITLPVTSTKSGVVTLTATYNGTVATVDVEFSPSAGTAAISSGGIEIVRNNALADGSDSNIVRVKVVDGEGNPVPNQTVRFSADHEAQIADSVITDDNGYASVNITSAKSGFSQIRASVNGSHYTRLLTFVADQSSAVPLLNMKENYALADGVDQNFIQVGLRDRNGNLVPGEQVTLRATQGVSVADSVNTGQNGHMTVPVTSTKSGTATLTATYNGITATVGVEFSPSSGTAVISSAGIDIVRNNALADGNDTNIVRVQVVDVMGNPVPNQTVRFSADHEAQIADSVITDQNGYASVNITSAKSGFSQIRASVNGSHYTRLLTFVADQSRAVPLLNMKENYALADGVDQNFIQVGLRDSNGNLVPGEQVALSATQGVSIAGSVNTGQNGHMTVPVTSTKSGTATLTATYNGITATVDVEFSPSAGTAAISSEGIEIVRNNALADGSDSNIVRVQVVDGKGNPVPNQTVRFSTDNVAQITDSVSTDENGYASTNITSISAGNVRIEASVNGNVKDVNVVFKSIEANAIDILIGATPAKARVNETINMVVLAKDLSGKSLGNAKIELTVSSVTNRQGKVVTAAPLVVNGKELSEKNTFYTDANGEVNLSVKDPLGSGVKRKLLFSSGNATNHADLIFTVITSPDSPLASMWGHMPDSLQVNNLIFYRTKLAAEHKGAGTKTENNEIWATYTQKQGMDLCQNRLPDVNQLKKLYDTYPSGKLNVLNGWPSAIEYRSSSFSNQLSSSYIRVSMTNYILTNGSNDSAKYIMCN
ncbi:Ig-like domain-containing protein [Enterobacter roggenkampii]|uniref:Ig-like domain-containing protein n=1 Tax=Enterobacter roggenkampii TaxID=1812935 RepID=UPI002238CB81|nr:Ig-like domain-containing protein [Enterobacter roggenkampii]MCW5004339.1 Ig-like domain-containing protein [Enterobacter roggenkampii]